MRIRKSRKTKFSSIDTSSQTQKGSEFSARLPSNYSQPTLTIENISAYESTMSIECQLTIRTKVELSRQQACLLAGISLFEIAYIGIGLTDWIVLEWLYSFLLGNKQEPLERKDPKERELALLLKIVLISGTWMGLEEKRKLPTDIRSLIMTSKWVPSIRTYSSWKETYRLDKFLEVQIVPLELVYERSKGTKRYSSYCKGYGESSRMGRRQKTRPSAELDGEPVEMEEKEISRPDQLRLTELVLKEIKYRQKNKK